MLRTKLLACGHIHIAITIKLLHLLVWSAVQIQAVASEK